MNVFSTMTDTVKLIIAGVALLILILVVTFVFSLFGDRAKLKEVKATDTRIAKTNTAGAKVAAKRDNASNAFFIANAQQATALAKELDDAENDFNDADRAVYFRVLNDSLRGPDRRDLRQAANLSAPDSGKSGLARLWNRVMPSKP